MSSTRRPKMRFHIAGLASLAILLALPGCGGGGGGGATVISAAAHWVNGGCSISAALGTIEYQTTWTAYPSVNGSQVIQIVSAAGNILRTESLNRGAIDTGEITIANLPAGVHEVRVRVFSGPNATGTEERIIRGVADLCSASTASVRTSVADTPTSYQVFPDQIASQQQRSVRLLGLAKIGASFAGAPLNQPIWSTTLGQISSTGALTFTTAGTGTATAAFGANTASAALAASPFTPVRTKWTVLVYLNAANDLYFASDLNVNQMESVAGNPDVRFVVQWKQAKSLYTGSSFDGVRRLLVKPDNTATIASEIVQNDLVNGAGQPLDMGDPQTLKDFIAWGRQYYPADRTCLIIWNHGNGWRRKPGVQPLAVSYDDATGRAIQTWELNDALGTLPFDIVAFDASLMQMMEVAYEIRSKASFIVGSEESPPANGYPYDAVFRAFRDAPDANTRDLTKNFVDAMVNHPPYAGQKITQSVIDSSQLPSLAAALNTLAQSLLTSTPPAAAIQAARNNAQSYSQTSQRYYRDLFDLCLYLESGAGMPASVVAASQSVRTAALNAIVWEGHNAQSPKSRGLAIDFTPGGVFAAAATDYSRLRFAVDTEWNEYLNIAP